MTLIIAGHCKAEDWLEEDGIFFAADSAITANGQTLLGGFRKVYPIPIKLWKPYFVDRRFKGYLREYFESECAIAFSGNTLTAQHILNSIIEHLGQLNIGYVTPAAGSVNSGYKIAMSCENNELFEKGGTAVWDDDMFSDKDYEGLLRAETVSKVVIHSINKALESAREYKLDDNGFKSLHSDFSLGVRCPVSGEYHLYVYRMQTRYNDNGRLEAYTTEEFISANQIAVLGKREKYEKGAQDKFSKILEEGGYTSGAMFDYLNESINEEKANCSREIDRPSFLKILNSKGLQKIDRRD